MIQTSVNEKISINYIEFNVKDIKQTKAFYQHLGWTFTDFGSSYCEFDSGMIKGGFAQFDTVQIGGSALVILYRIISSTVYNVSKRLVERLYATFLVSLAVVVFTLKI